MSSIVTAVLLVLGSGFMLLAGVGVIRLPDLFMRMQAATKAATLGVGCMLLAVAVHFSDLAVTTRVVLVIAFVFLTAPVAAHVIARAAYSVGVPLWEGTFCDELRDRRAAEAAGNQTAAANLTAASQPTSTPADPQPVE
jgi:multicomponent Na+:H+ antiporter subunit G